MISIISNGEICISQSKEWTRRTRMRWQKHDHSEMASQKRRRASLLMLHPRRPSWMLHRLKVRLSNPRQRTALRWNRNIILIIERSIRPQALNKKTCTRKAVKVRRRGAKGLVISLKCELKTMEHPLLALKCLLTWLWIMARCKVRRTFICLRFKNDFPYQPR